jgi:hypothetical protein
MSHVKIISVFAAQVASTIQTPKHSLLQQFSKKPACDQGEGT